MGDRMDGKSEGLIDRRVHGWWMCNTSCVDEGLDGRSDAQVDQWTDVWIDFR